MAKEFFSCRDVLWYLVFSGAAVNYMLKINLNLVIVAMVKPRKTIVSISQCAALAGNSSVWTNVTAAPHLSDITSSTIAPEEPDYSDKFDWSEYDQGLILGAFFWLYWSTQVPGGILGHRYGAKLMFGGGNLAAAFINLLLPFAMKYHLIGLVALRALQGFIMGTMYPSMSDLPGKWVPANERSRFLTAYLGGSVGTALTYPLCAVIIYYFNWEAAFYVTSCIAFVWFSLWCYCVYNTPQEHPRISRDELEYILKNTPPEDTRKRRVPWLAILTSMPLWITIIAHWGGIWGFTTLLSQTPSYFNYIHGWSINMTGILSGAPHMVLFCFAYFYAKFSDWLLTTEKVKRTVVRKMAIFVGTGGQAVAIIGLSFSGCSPILAVIFMILGTALNGSMSAGTIATFVDLSPNYAGITFGLGGLIVNAAGVLVPMIVGILTNNNQTIEQWRLVFLIAAANLLVGCAFFMIWGTSKEQEWNNYERNSVEEQGEELEKLKVQPDSKVIVAPNDQTRLEKPPKSETTTYEWKTETKTNNAQNHS